MWCFFDESWPPTQGTEKIGVLIAILVQKKTIKKLDDLIYAVIRKYWGKERAKDHRYELKGSNLLSRYTFRLQRQYDCVINHSIVQEILLWCKNNNHSDPCPLFGSVVFGENPRLECLASRKLELPFKDICEKISIAAKEINPRGQVSLIFDQRFTAETGIAISIRNFIVGMGLRNLNPYPYFAVSNVAPVIQIADICAYITGRRAIGDPNFHRWYRKVTALQWNGEVRGKQRWGLQRYDECPGNRYRIRKKW